METIRRSKRGGLTLQGVALILMVLSAPPMLHLLLTFSCHRPHTEVDGCLRGRAPVLECVVFGHEALGSG